MTLDEMIAGLEEAERSAENDLVKIIKAQEIGLFLFTPERQLAKTIENRHKSNLQKIKRNLGWFRELKRFRERENSMTNKALVSKPCEDAISRQAAIRIAEQGQVQGYEWQFKELIKLPPVTPEQKPKTGKWIESKGYDDRDHFYICSECGRYINLNCGAKLSDYPYCHCGAKMVEPQEGEDLGDYPDTIRNQFDNMTGSMNL